MNVISGYIILRDIVKSKAQLDLSIFDIQGGFRGFSGVLAGPHYVSIEHGDEMIEGFWCYVDTNEVVVRIYDFGAKKFNEDEPENIEHYSSLARSGAMNRALIHVLQMDSTYQLLWAGLVDRIKKHDFPPAINNEVPMIPPTNVSTDELSNWYATSFKSRFEQAYYDTHEGDLAKFLAEFQYVFIKWLMKQTDNQAWERWINLLQAIYNAGERVIMESLELFVPLVDIIINQMKTLSPDMFSADNVIIHKVDHLIEDMEDTGISELKEKAKELKVYLESRGIQL